MSTAHRRYLSILIGAGLVTAIALGLRQSFGLFLEPYSALHPGGRGVFGLSIALQNLLWGFLSPAFGAWADRRGAGRVVALGALCYSAGLFAMAGSYSLPSSALMLSQLLVGVGLSGCGISVVLGAVGRAAPPAQRARALGIVTAAGSLGQFALAPFAGYLLNTLGWPLALAVLAVLAGSMGFAAAALREERGKTDVRTVALVATGSCLREAMSDRDYLLLTTGFFVCGLQVVFIMTHLPSYLTELGLGSTLKGVPLSSWALGLIGLFNVGGTIAWSWIGDRYSKKNALSWLYALRSAVILAFILLPPTVLGTLLFSACMGLLWLGTIPLTNALVAHFYGTSNMSMLCGVVFLSHQLGSFLGASLGAWTYQVYGSYEVTWWLTIAAGLVAAALHYPIRELPRLQPAT